MTRFVSVGVCIGLCGLGLAVAAGLAVNSNRLPSGSPPAANAAASDRTASGKPAAADTGRGMAAIQDAAKANKYLFLLAWKNDDADTRSMRETLESAMKQVSARATSVSVNIAEPQERPIVEKFDLQRAPMPLIIALAPNGAITGGFPSKVDEKRLLDAFATPCTERCMKALQRNRLVFVCVQNENTKANEAVIKGVRAFQADSRYQEVTEIVMLNPADSAEAPFLRDLKISPATTEAVVAFMVPPGAVIAEFRGETTKEILISALEKAGSGSCPGGKCGPGGCGPQP